MSGQALVTISGNQWSVSVANTPAELQSGLGGVVSIPASTGMLFDLGSEKAVTVTTQPMLFNIDIIFINQALAVVGISQNIAPGYQVTENTPVRFFLEVNAGEAAGIQVGDQVTLTGYTPPAPTTTTNLADTMGALMPLLIMFMFFMMMRTITSRLFPTRGGAQLPPRYAPVSQTRAPAPTKPTLPPPARPSPTPAPLAKTAERELEERRVEFENKGKEMARQAGVEFIRVEHWQSKSEFPVYWFRDAKGNNIRALDLEELKGKVAILAKHHSPGDKIWYLGEWWKEEYSTAEYTVYSSADGKRELTVYWDGSKVITPAYSEQHSSSNPGKTKPCPKCGKPLHLLFDSKHGQYFWSHEYRMSQIMAGEKVCDYSEKAEGDPPGFAIMPKLPPEARGDFLFYEYIRDLVKLGEEISDEEAKRMWEAWKESHAKVGVR